MQKTKRSFIKLFLTAMFTFATLTILGMISYAAPLTEGYYYICASDDNNYAIDVCNGSSAQGTYVQLYRRSNNNSAQIFKVEKAPGASGWYVIKNASTGLCLNIAGGANANGTRIWMYGYDYTPACHFRFDDCGNNTYRIVSAIGNRIIDLDNNLRHNGSRIHTWQSHYGASAKWTFLPAIRDNGVYQIEFKNSGSGLNVQYRRPASYDGGKANIVMDRLNKEDNEKWIFQYNSAYNAYYIMPEYRPESALNALYGSAATRGRQVIIHPSNINDTASLWRIEYDSGYVRFKNVACGYYIDIDNGRTAAGTRANLWSSSASNQRFRLNYLYDSATWQYPLKGYWRTQVFGGDSGHLGIDIKSDNTTVYAAASGRVAKTGANFGKNGERYLGNGYFVIIEHEISGKKVYSMYAHLKEKSIIVSEGQQVTKGQPIATMGNTGNSNGPHLHFAIASSLKSNGAYYGYTDGRVSFSGNSKRESRSGITFYNPEYVIKNNRLP